MEQKILKSVPRHFPHPRSFSKRSSRYHPPEISSSRERDCSCKRASCSSNSPCAKRGKITGAYDDDQFVLNPCQNILSEHILLHVYARNIPIENSQLSLREATISLILTAIAPSQKHAHPTRTRLRVRAVESKP